MTRGTRRARGGRAPPSTSQLAMRMRNLEKRLTGYKTIPQDNPPAFVQLPWNSFTFEVTQTGDAPGITQIITIGTILTQIATKCGLSIEPPNVANVRVKVQSAQVWCTVAATLLQPDMEVKFYELSGEPIAANQQARSIQRDLGTLNKPAKVGYVFPNADKREIIGTDDVAALKVLSAEAVAGGSRLTSRVQVLWQSSP